MLELRLARAGAQLVEDVIVPLVVRLKETSGSVAGFGQPGLAWTQSTWKTTRDFSSRYVLMLAPVMRYLLSKLISVYLPKRLLLSFLVVFAFPMAWRGTPPLQVRNSEGATPVSYLRYWIGCQDFVLNSCFTSRFADHSKVPHGVSGRHRFTSSRLTADDD